MPDDPRDTLHAEMAWSSYRLTVGVDQSPVEAAHLAFLAGWAAKGKDMNLK